MVFRNAGHLRLVSASAAGALHLCKDQVLHTQCQKLDLNQRMCGSAAHLIPGAIQSSHPVLKYMQDAGKVVKYKVVNGAVKAGGGRWAAESSTGSKMCLVKCVVCVMCVCVCVRGYVCARRWASVLAGSRTCCHVCFGLID